MLYIQGYGMGMLDAQLEKLTEEPPERTPNVIAAPLTPERPLVQVLKRPECQIWAMNIGESPRLSDHAW